MAGGASVVPFVYGEPRTDQEVVAFVRDYVDAVKRNPHDRYHGILSLVPDGSAHTLDYGCGWGHYAIAMRDKGNRVVAIDPSENEIEICRLVWGDQKDVVFQHDSIEAHKAASFDVVLSNQVVEHVYNVGNYMSQVNRVLVDGGRLVISTPNIMNPRFFLAQLHQDLEARLRRLGEGILAGADKTHDHVNAWDPIHFVTMCAAFGFSLERYLPTEGIAMPFGWPLGGPYIHHSATALGNLSYTMTFAFTKVHDVAADPHD